MSSDASAQAREMVLTISRLEALASLAEHPDVVKAGVVPYELGQGIRQALSGACPELLTPDGCPLVAASPGDPQVIEERIRFVEKKATGRRTTCPQCILQKRASRAE